MDSMSAGGVFRLALSELLAAWYSFTSSFLARRCPASHLLKASAGTPGQHVNTCEPAVKTHSAQAPGMPSIYRASAIYLPSIYQASARHLASIHRA